MNIITESTAKGFLEITEKILKRMGFTDTFICVSHLVEENSIGCPFIIDFKEHLLVDFLFYFLNIEQNKQIKEELFNRFNPVDDEVREFVKTVKL